MVDTLWQTLTAETASADNQRKAELLQSIVKAAFYQPRHALEFVNAIIRATPRSVDGPDDESAPWAYSARQVTYAISPVLQNIAHNLDYLLPAAELLWALAQEDARPANQHPGHPLRILQALARLSYARPQGYVRALLGAAKIWLSKPYKVSPFEVLEPVLATEGNEELWSDSVLTFYAYRISPRQVRELRQQVIDMAAKEARESAPPIAVRAIKTLEMAIKQPHGAYGREPTPDELSEWRDEFIPVLELMESIGVQPEIDPVVRIAIRNAVQWHAAYGAEPTKSAANAVVAGLYEGPDDGLSRCLHSFWDRMDLRPRRDYAAAEEAVIREDQRVIESLIERSTVDDVLNLIETRIVQERASFDNDGSTRFFWNMYSLAPDLAIRACESALVAGHPGIAPYTSQALAALINAQNPAVIDICRRMLATDDLELHRSVAAGLAANRAEGSCLSPDELTLLHRLAESEDRQIRASIGRAAFMVGLSDTDTMHAYDLLARVRFGDSGEIAAEVLHGFVDRGPLSWTHAGEAYSQAVLAQLGQCPSIDHYLLMAAVSELSLIDPLGVTRMLLRRIELSRSESFLDYRPLPMHWHPSLRVRETAELGRCLVEIREWLRDHINGGSRFYAYSDAAQLFSTVVGDWNDEALASLGDVSSATSKEELVAAALILAHAPYEVLFSNTTLVARLLHRAEAFGHDESSDVFRALLPTNHEIVTVWANGPDQDEADKHDRARRVATVLPAGSIQRRFFEAFAAAIEARTLFVRDSAEELEDRRDW
jgi:hypothetical protein